MSSGPQYQLSRREALAGFAAVAAYSRADSSFECPIGYQQRSGRTQHAPTSTRGGPSARLYGEDEGYPVPEILRAQREGNPWEPRYRVGAFSHLDEIYRTRRVNRSASPWMFKRSAADIRYQFHGHQS